MALAIEPITTKKEKNKREMDYVSEVLVCDNIPRLKAFTVLSSKWYNLIGIPNNLDFYIKTVRERHILTSGLTDTNYFLGL